MANNNSPVEKKSFFQKLASLPSRIAKGFSNMWHELKKVSWPTRKQLINYTMIVLAFMLFMGVVIGILDTVATQLVNIIS